MTITVASGEASMFFIYSKYQFSFDDWGVIPVGTRALMYFKKPFIIRSLDSITDNGVYSLDGINTQDDIQPEYKLKFYVYAYVETNNFISWLGLDTDEVKAHYNITDTAAYKITDIPGYDSFFRLSYNKPHIVTSDMFDELRPSDDELGINDVTRNLFANNMKLDDSLLGDYIDEGSIPISEYAQFSASTIIKAEKHDNGIKFTCAYSVHTPMTSVYPFYTLVAKASGFGALVFTGVEPI